MPILPDSANTVQIVLKGTNQGTNWSNKFHLHSDIAFTSSTSSLSTLCDSVATAWTTNIAPLCQNQVFLTEVDAVDLSSRISPAFVSSRSPAPPGTRAGVALPTQVAMAMSIAVTRRYRGGHGRIYIPAGVVADVTSGRLWNPAAAAMLANANAAAAAFYTALNGLTIGAVQMRLIVLSYWTSTPPVPPSTHGTPVLRTTPLVLVTTGMRVRTRVDTQRRRLGKEVI